MNVRNVEKVLAGVLPFIAIIESAMVRNVTLVMSVERPTVGAHPSFTMVKSTFQKFLPFPAKMV